MTLPYPVQPAAPQPGGWIGDIVLFPILCAFSLLFLLMKETTLTGSINVTVSGAGFNYSTLVPSSGPHIVTVVTQQVNYARSLAG